MPFGRPKRLRSGSDSLQTCCCGHHLCRQTVFLGVQLCRLAGLKGSAAALDSLQTCCCGHHLCCCGHHLCRQTVFLGVQLCRLAGLKGYRQLANVLLWPPPVPADCFLGGSIVPFGRPKRVRSGFIDSLQTCCYVLLWPPPVPADCFLGGSIVPFGRPKRLRSGSDSLQRAAVLGGSIVPFGRPKRLRSGSDSLQTCCCGHRLCRQTLFLGVQMRSRSTPLANVLLWATAVPADCFLGGSSVPFGRPKRLRSGSDSLQTCCCGHHLCRQTLFLGFNCAVWPA